MVKREEEVKAAYGRPMGEEVSKVSMSICEAGEIQGSRPGRFIQGRVADDDFRLTI